MKCKKCGAELIDGARFCGNCGAFVEIEDFNNIVEAEVVEKTDEPVAEEPKPELAYEAPKAEPAYEMPKEEPMYEAPKAAPAPIEHAADPNAPASVWTFFGLLILYGIPVIGLIFVLLFSFGITENKNIKSFSRAVFLLRILTAIVSVVLAVFVSRVAGDSIVNWIKMF